MRTIDDYNKVMNLISKGMTALEISKKLKIPRSTIRDWIKGSKPSFNKIAITDEEFKKLVKNSISLREVIRGCGLVPAGGNYKTIKAKIKSLKINTSHFKGQGYLKGKKHNWNKKIPMNEILVKDSTYTSSNSLRKRLIKEGYFKEICNKCKNTEWLGEKIPLDLEHKNGNNTDNRIENLELLCPNCHSFTPTYKKRKT